MPAITVIGNSAADTIMSTFVISFCALATAIWYSSSAPRAGPG